jgi:glycosyltransferase involved in cell wall biosynthesis
MRIAAFSFRSIPLRPGCAGADKFAAELFPRLVARGHQVVAYNRLYPGEQPIGTEYKGVEIRNVYTPTAKKGFDTLLHGFKCVWDIIVNNTGDVVHMQNGGNSPFALILRLFGKKVFLSQDGVDWKRAKWPWYGRVYLWLTQYVSAFAPTAVIFDNVFCKAEFEKRFRRRYDFIPFGSEVSEEGLDTSILDELGLEPGSYFLFVGRFIPDKGLQYLVPAFEKLRTTKKLVLVGGSPNPSDFERRIRATTDPRIVFPGFVYGSKTHALMKNAYAYIQPSDIEGLSPVILENMGLGVPVICSDIQENQFVVGDTALTFRKADPDDLQRQLEWALANPEAVLEKGRLGRERASALFSWEIVADAHQRIFTDIAEFRAHDSRVQSSDPPSSPGHVEPAGDGPTVLKRERETTAH